jgi:hypothetical protein
MARRWWSSQKHRKLEKFPTLEAGDSKIDVSIQVDRIVLEARGTDQLWSLQT